MESNIENYVKMNEIKRKTYKHTKGVLKVF